MVEKGRLDVNGGTDGGGRKIGKQEKVERFVRDMKVLGNREREMGGGSRGNGVGVW